MGGVRKWVEQCRDEHGERLAADLCEQLTRFVVSPSAADWAELAQTTITDAVAGGTLGSVVGRIDPKVDENGRGGPVPGGLTTIRAIKVMVRHPRHGHRSWATENRQQ